LTVLGLLAASAVAAAGPAHWLDQPLSAWSDGPGVPTAGPVDRSASQACFASPPTGAGTEAVWAAGWRPFHMFDRPIGRGPLVVLGGLRGLTADCAPAAFQLFVFVDGAFAGTLSPVEMTTGHDGAAGTIRVLPDGGITVEFARYAAGDSECCPSGRVRVSYRIDRNGGRPRVVAVDRKSLRE
jgi:hypothetical protein